jgi:hypothetical protein
MIFSPYLLPYFLYNPTTLLIAVISFKFKPSKWHLQLLSLIIQVSRESHSLRLFSFLSLERGIMILEAKEKCREGETRDLIWSIEMKKDCCHGLNHIKSIWFDTFSEDFPSFSLYFRREVFGSSSYFHAPSNNKSDFLKVPSFCNATQKWNLINFPLFDLV